MHSINFIKYGEGENARYLDISGFQEGDTMVCLDVGEEFSFFGKKIIGLFGGISLLEGEGARPVIESKPRSEQGFVKLKFPPGNTCYRALWGYVEEDERGTCFVLDEEPENLMPVGSLSQEKRRALLVNAYGGQE